MAEFPALPLFTDAYLGDTTHLTTIEHGAYLLLLITAWRRSDTALPDDDRLLARYTRTTAAQWKRLRPVLADFFVIREGQWQQPRLTDEATAVRQHREKMAENGRASALKRKGRHSTKREPSANEASTPIPYTDTNVSGAEAPVLDLKKMVFDGGRQILIATGMSAAKAGQMVGKWRRDHDDETLLAILPTAADKSDPVSWIEAALKGRAAANPLAAVSRDAARYRAMEQKSVNGEVRSQ